MIKTIAFTITITITLLLTTSHALNLDNTEQFEQTEKFAFVSSQEDCEKNPDGYWSEERDECVCKRKSTIVACILQFLFGIFGGGCWYAGFNTPALITTIVMSCSIVMGCIGLFFPPVMVLAGLGALFSVVYGYTWFFILAFNEKVSPAFNCYLQ